MFNSHVHGNVTGTGTALFCCIGFEPSHIEFYNSDGLVVAKWSAIAGALVGVKVADAGAATNVAAMVAGITTYAGGDAGSAAHVDRLGTAIAATATTVSGFQIGTDADLNAAAQEIFYCAFR